MMKKILSLFVLLLALTSCEEDIKFNTPAVQGFKDDELWKAAEYTAVRGADNSLTITATNGFEIVTLKTASVDAGSYQLGVNTVNMASYVVSVDGIEMNYQTGAGMGDGEIIISANPTETNVTGGYISGQFRFNAVDDEGGVVNFRDGVFYKVPIQGSNP